MKQKGKSIRAFIGSKNFEVSRNFYRDLGFHEKLLSKTMAYISSGELGFYLQDAYVQDWIDNTMIFLEVEDVNGYYQELLQLNLPAKYNGVKLIPIRQEVWGSECFLHDPSGVLWHFGQFSSAT